MKNSKKHLGIKASEFFDRSALVLALGVFDGVHKGHIAVLKKTLSLAKKFGAKSAVLTFFPHPSKITKTRVVRLVSTLEQRIEKIKSQKINKVFVKNFDKEFSKKSPEEFLIFLKESFPNLKALVSGENFHFGSNASGGAEWLKNNSKNFGIQYCAVKGVYFEGSRVSSSRLRSLIEDGKVDYIKDMNFNPYSAFGKVIAGKKLGKKLGFPTLNIKFNPDCKPPYGVYLTKVKYLGKKKFSSYAVSNYGLNPTVEKISEPILESNLFKTPNFSTGAKIEVEFLKFLRAEKKFPSLEALKKQIFIDKAEAFKILSSNF